MMFMTNRGSKSPKRPTRASTLLMPTHPILPTSTATKRSYNTQAPSCFFSYFKHFSIDQLKSLSINKPSSSSPLSCSKVRFPSYTGLKTLMFSPSHENSEPLPGLSTSSDVLEFTSLIFSIQRKVAQFIIASPLPIRHESRVPRQQSTWRRPCNAIHQTPIAHS